MHIVIRTDSSVQIGSGHVMRCLTLAERLREMGADVLFVCRELVGNLNDFISDRGFKLCRLPAPAARNLVLDWNRHASWLGIHWRDDASETLKCLRNKTERIAWLVVDHYALDRNWERQQRPLVDNIMVIDDLADRHHDCNLLLDQNLYKGSESRYKGLVPKDCLKLLGPKYALLRSEFIVARKYLHKRDGNIRRILIFFGGVDSADVTSKALEAVNSLNSPDIKVDVVVGDGNQQKEKVKHLCKSMPNAQYYCQVDNMAELMSAADIAIGGGGSTTWERCFLGLPSIVVTMADNQVEAAEIVARHGASHCMGSYDGFSADDLARILGKFINNSDRVLQMSIAASEIMQDFQGVDGVVKELMELR